MERREPLRIDGGNTLRNGLQLLIKRLIGVGKRHTKRQALR